MVIGTMKKADLCNKTDMGTGNTEQSQNQWSRRPVRGRSAFSQLLAVMKGPFVGCGQRELWAEESVSLKLLERNVLELR